MAKAVTIRIATDFARVPGPRKREQGASSGEEFRDTLLAPKLEEATREGATLIVNLDGATGYGTSFLEEAFGGLIRRGYPRSAVEAIQIISEEEPWLKREIDRYIAVARPE